MSANPQSCTVFDGSRRIFAGPLHQAALAVHKAVQRGFAGPLLVFDDATGRVIDLDTRGSADDVAARYTSHPPAATADFSDTPAEAAPRKRGRPSLGVVAREVTLLPRHWEWLAGQPGGASVALRRLVEEARRSSAHADQRRAARDTAYRFLSAMGGNFPGFEEASRALFADDAERFAHLIAGWPEDVRDYAQHLAFPATSDPDYTLADS